MTAGLPGTHSGRSTFHWRILAALLIMTIAAAPARAQYAASPDSDSAAPARVEGAAMTTDADVIGEAPEATDSTEASAAIGATEAPTEAAAATADALPAERTLPAAGAEAPSTDKAPAPSLDQVFYKGVVGNILEAMPLDPEQRVQLQRGNAIINNAFAGRSVALLLGIASPPLMIAGLIWGIWSAINIKSAPADTRTALVPSQPAVEAEEPVPAAEPVQAPRSDDSVSPDRDHVAAQSLD
jgi:hypothetical protein